ncbi:DUF397 domain-containing protein [Saccharopolyspora gloriosae]|uniref:DUF397 domain-containing protein n=1 Tax=Saccharopolyspora gloriosae TaxID=455344 RepID=UPI001FB5B03E|nr:DUF397 domain-containing protein [Saccharopolyspora gloriosae]
MNDLQQDQVLWRKSSRSASSANCVEVAFDWRKSSRSISAANCVEVAEIDAAVGVRDSKEPQGGVLVFPSRRWKDFLAALGDVHAV